MNTSSQSERGSIVVVLLVLLTLLGLGVTSLFLTTSSVRVATNIKLTNDARVVAESGLERARDILLSDPTSVPLATLLVGSGIPADEVPHDATRCLGEARGAVLVDFRDTHKVPLLDVDFPTIDRRSDLPAGAGNVVPQTLGHYTVYVRQDLADCRMGNFTCDFAASTDSRTCEPPAGAPQPNHYVIVRSEGVAADGKSRDFAEATYFLGGTTLPGEPGGDAGVGPGIDAGSSSGAGGGSGGAGGVGGSGGTGGVGGATSTFPAPCLSYAVTAVAGCSGGWFKGCITINSSSLVDSFSSEVGPYGYSNKGAASIAMTCSKAAATSSCPNNCPSGCITGTVVYGQPSTFDASTIPVPAHVLNSNHVTVPSNVTLSPATPDWPSHARAESSNQQENERKKPSAVGSGATPSSAVVVRAWSSGPSARTTSIVVTSSPTRLVRDGTTRRWPSRPRTTVSTGTQTRRSRSTSTVSGRWRTGTSLTATSARTTCTTPLSGSS